MSESNALSKVRSFGPESVRWGKLAYARVSMLEVESRHLVSETKVSVRENIEMKRARSESNTRHVA